MFYHSVVRRCVTVDRINMEFCCMTLSKAVYTTSGEGCSPIETNWHSIEPPLADWVHVDNLAHAHVLAAARLLARDGRSTGQRCRACLV